jgi:hypothetical protein
MSYHTFVAAPVDPASIAGNACQLKEVELENGKIWANAGIW